jgi:alanine-synthesizing transaminase
VSLNGGKPKYYECLPKNAFQPDLAQMETLINDKTRAIVIINPNNPSGAVYSRETLEQIVALAARNDLVVLADEIYDQMVYDTAEFVPVATLVDDALCLTFAGLSKVYRACGYRVGWCVFSGNLDRAKDYLHAMELLAALRLCANVPGQWAVQTALGGFQSIRELVRPGGRLHQQRQAIIDRVNDSPYLSLQPPQGAMYAFIKLDDCFAGALDDRAFALELLEHQHVLVAPGSSFNTTYDDHFRITTLPDVDTINAVFVRMNTLLEQHA